MSATSSTSAARRSGRAVLLAALVSGCGAAAVPRPAPVAADPIATQAAQAYDEGVALARKAAWTDAAARFAAAARLRPDDARAWLSQAACQEHAGDAAAGETYARALALDAASLPAALGAARALVAREAPAEAAVVLERALAAQPDDSTLLVALASARCLAGYADEAHVLARRVITVEPQNVVALQVAGLAQADLGHLELAEIYLRAALTLAPRDLDVRVGLAVVAARRGDDARALAELDAVLAIDPAHAAANADVGALALANRDYDRAARAFAAALGAGLTTCATTSGLGFALEGRKDGAGAVAALERARAACPDDGDLSLALGDVSEGLLRDHAAALRHYRAYAGAHPGLPAGHRVFGLIRSLTDLVAAGDAQAVDSPPGR